VVTIRTSERQKYERKEYPQTPKHPEKPPHTRRSTRTPLPVTRIETRSACSHASQHHGGVRHVRWEIVSRATHYCVWLPRVTSCSAVHPMNIY
jgi:hypothetical protein